MIAFSQQEGRPPGGLEELVPDYLSGIPVDIFNGGPLRYAVSTNAQWRIYSVGPDGVDDGGIGESYQGPDYVEYSDQYIVPLPAATNTPAASTWHRP